MAAPCPVWAPCPGRTAKLQAQPHTVLTARVATESLGAACARLAPLLPVAPSARFPPPLRCAVNSLARKTKAIKEGEPNLAGEYIREGLGAVVSVKASAAASAGVRPAYHLPVLARMPGTHAWPAAACAKHDAVHAAPQVPNPEFEGQTKTRLGNPEVRRIVEGVVGSGAGPTPLLHLGQAPASQQGRRRHSRAPQFGPLSLVRTHAWGHS